MSLLQSFSTDLPALMINLHCNNDYTNKNAVYVQRDVHLQRRYQTKNRVSTKIAAVHRIPVAEAGFPINVYGLHTLAFVNTI